LLRLTVISPQKNFIESGLGACGGIPRKKLTFYLLFMYVIKIIIMTTFIKHLSEPWFTLTKLGIKTCEGRLNKGDFREMKPGDFIIFENDDLNFQRIIRVKIISIENYDSFESYLQNETLEKCLPGIDTIEEGLSIYEEYYNYKKWDYKTKAIRLIVV
jgi:ASC-1-like (ASCH) protein